MGDGASSFAVIDTDRQVLVNSKKIPSSLKTDRTEIILTRSVSRSSVSFIPSEFIATPSASSVATIELDRGYEVDGDVEWESKATSAVDIAYRLSGFDVGEEYVVERDGSGIVEVVANGAGGIEFSDSLEAGEEFEYEVK